MRILVTGATGNAGGAVLRALIDANVWSVYFGPIHLGWLDEADYRLMDVMERKRRRR